MAKKWMVGEAIKALKSGDKEARLDLGRRFPLFCTSTFEEILNAIDFISVRKIEKVLRGGALDDEDDVEAEVDVKEEKKSKKEKSDKTEKKDKKAEKKAKKKEEKKAPKKKVEDDDDDELIDDDDDDDIFDDDDE